MIAQNKVDAQRKLPSNQNNHAITWQRHCAIKTQAKLLHAANMSLKAEGNKMDRVRPSDATFCVLVLEMVFLMLLLLLTVVVA